MGSIHITINDELEDEFRKKIAVNMGLKKGNISIAIEKAIRLWIDNNRKKRSEIAKKAWKTRKKEMKEKEKEDKND